jgi:hypothetical protein
MPKETLVYFAAVYGIKRQNRQNTQEDIRGIMKHFFMKRGCSGPFGAMDIIHSGEFHPAQGGMDRERGARCTGKEEKELTEQGKV